MLSYRKLAMRVLGRPLNTGGGNKFTPSALSPATAAVPNARNPTTPCP